MDAILGTLSGIGSVVIEILASVLYVIFAFIISLITGMVTGFTSVVFVAVTEIDSQQISMVLKEVFADVNFSGYMFTNIVNVLQQLTGIFMQFIFPIAVVASLVAILRIYLPGASEKTIDKCKGVIFFSAASIAIGSCIRTFSALGTKASIDIRYDTPYFNSLQLGLIIVAMSIALFIAVFELWRGLFSSVMGEDNVTHPTTIGFRLMFTVIGINFAYPFTQLLFDIVQKTCRKLYKGAIGLGTPWEVFKNMWDALNLLTQSDEVKESLGFFDALQETAWDWVMPMTLNTIAMIIFLLIAYNFLRLVFECTVKIGTVILGMYSSPIAIAFGPSPNTGKVVSSWLKVYISSLVMLISNGVLVVIATAMITHPPADPTNQLSWALLLFGFLKAAQQIDQYINLLGGSVMKVQGNFLRDFWAMNRAKSAAMGAIGSAYSMPSRVRAAKVAYNDSLASNTKAGKGGAGTSLGTRAKAVNAAMGAVVSRSKATPDELSDSKRKLMEARSAKSDIVNGAKRALNGENLAKAQNTASQEAKRATANREKQQQVATDAKNKFEASKVAANVANGKAATAKSALDTQNARINAADKAQKNDKAVAAAQAYKNAKTPEAKAAAEKDLAKAMGGADKLAKLGGAEAMAGLIADKKALDAARQETPGLQHNYDTARDAAKAANMDKKNAGKDSQEAYQKFADATAAEDSAKQKLAEATSNADKAGVGTADLGQTMPGLALAYNNAVSPEKDGSKWEMDPNTARAQHDENGNTVMAATFQRKDSSGNVIESKKAVLDAAQTRSLMQGTASGKMKPMKGQDINKLQAQAGSYSYAGSGFGTRVAQTTKDDGKGNQKTTNANQAVSVTPSGVNKNGEQLFRARVTENGKPVSDDIYTAKNADTTLDTAAKGILSGSYDGLKKDKEGNPIKEAVSSGPAPIGGINPSNFSPVQNKDGSRMITTAGALGLADKMPANTPMAISSNAQGVVTATPLGQDKPAAAWATSEKTRQAMANGDFSSLVKSSPVKADENGKGFKQMSGAEQSAFTDTGNKVSGKALGLSGASGDENFAISTRSMGDGNYEVKATDKDGNTVASAIAGAQAIEAARYGQAEWSDVLNGKPYAIDGLKISPNSSADAPASSAYMATMGDKSAPINIPEGYTPQDASNYLQDKLSAKDTAAFDSANAGKAEGIRQQLGVQSPSSENNPNTIAGLKATPQDDASNNTPASTGYSITAANGREANINVPTGYTAQNASDYVNGKADAETKKAFDAVNEGGANAIRSELGASALSENTSAGMSIVPSENAGSNTFTATGANGQEAAVNVPAGYTSQDANDYINGKANAETTKAFDAVNEGGANAIRSELGASALNGNAVDGLNVTPSGDTGSNTFTATGANGQEAAVNVPAGYTAQDASDYINGKANAETTKAFDAANEGGANGIREAMGAAPLSEGNAISGLSVSAAENAGSNTFTATGANGQEAAVNVPAGYTSQDASDYINGKANAETTKAFDAANEGGANGIREAMGAAPLGESTNAVSGLNVVPSASAESNTYTASDGNGHSSNVNVPTGYTSQDASDYINGRASAETTKAFDAVNEGGADAIRSNMGATSLGENNAVGGLSFEPNANAGSSTFTATNANGQEAAVNVPAGYSANDASAYISGTASPEVQQAFDAINKGGAEPIRESLGAHATDGSPASIDGLSVSAPENAGSSTFTATDGNGNSANINVPTGYTAADAGAYVNGTASAEVQKAFDAVNEGGANGIRESMGASAINENADAISGLNVAPSAIAYTATDGNGNSAEVNVPTGYTSQDASDYINGKANAETTKAFDAVNDGGANGVRETMGASALNDSPDTISGLSVSASENAGSSIFTATDGNGNSANVNVPAGYTAQDANDYINGKANEETTKAFDAANEGGANSIRESMGAPAINESANAVSGLSVAPSSDAGNNSNTFTVSDANGNSAEVNVPVGHTAAEAGDYINGKADAETTKAFDAVNEGGANGIRESMGASAIDENAGDVSGLSVAPSASAESNAFTATGANGQEAAVNVPAGYTAQDANDYINGRANEETTKAFDAANEGGANSIRENLGFAAQEGSPAEISGLNVSAQETGVTSSSYKVSAGDESFANINIPTGYTAEDAKSYIRGEAPEEMARSFDSVNAGGAESFREQLGIASTQEGNSNEISGMTIAEQKPADGESSSDTRQYTVRSADGNETSITTPKDCDSETVRNYINGETDEKTTASLDSLNKGGANEARESLGASALAEKTNDADSLSVEPNGDSGNRTRQYTVTDGEGHETKVNAPDGYGASDVEKFVNGQADEKTSAAFTEANPGGVNETREKLGASALKEDTNSNGMEGLSMSRVESSNSIADNAYNVTTADGATAPVQIPQGSNAEEAMQYVNKTAPEAVRTAYDAANPGGADAIREKLGVADSDHAINGLNISSQESSSGGRFTAEANNQKVDLNIPAGLTPRDAEDFLNGVATNAVRNAMEAANAGTLDAFRQKLGAENMPKEKKGWGIVGSSRKASAEDYYKQFLEKADKEQNDANAAIPGKNSGKSGRPKGNPGKSNQKNGK